MSEQRSYFEVRMFSIISTGLLRALVWYSPGSRAISTLAPRSAQPGERSAGDPRALADSAANDAGCSRTAVAPGRRERLAYPGLLGPAASHRTHRSSFGSGAPGPDQADSGSELHPRLSNPPRQGSCRLSEKPASACLPEASEKQMSARAHARQRALSAGGRPRVAGATAVAQKVDMQLQLLSRGA